MLTAQEIYAAARTLPLPERLRLAALILDDLNQTRMPQTDPGGLSGYDDAWTDEDIRDFRHHSEHYLRSTEATSGLEQENALPPLEDLLRLKTEQSR